MFQLAVGAGVTHSAVVFQLAVQAGGAPHAALLQLAMRAGGALCAVDFPLLAVGAPGALRTLHSAHWSFRLP